jgi:hypothetical protein
MNTIYIHMLLQTINSHVISLCSVMPSCQGILKCHQPCSNVVQHGTWMFPNDTRTMTDFVIFWIGYNHFLISACLKICALKNDTNCMESLYICYLFIHFRHVYRNLLEASFNHPTDYCHTIYQVSVFYLY